MAIPVLVSDNQIYQAAEIVVSNCLIMQRPILNMSCEINLIQRKSLSGHRPTNNAILEHTL